MMIHKPLWHAHPHVRTGSELSVGERAADVLKRAFGSWTFMICLNGFIALWAVLNALGVFHFDAYPFIALNLVLSWLAAQQGGALQIAANRGDRIASELALSTHANGEQLLAMNTQQLTILNQQTEMLTELRELRALVEAPDPAPDQPIQRGGLGVPGGDAS